MTNEVAERQVICLPTREDRTTREHFIPIRSADLVAKLVEQLPHNQRQRFFDLSMDMFCIAGLEGYFHRVNSNFSRVLGFTKREMLSRPIESFVHPDDMDKTNKAFEVLSAGMPIVRFQNRYLDINGKYHTFEWTAKSIPAFPIRLISENRLVSQAK